MYFIEFKVKPESDVGIPSYLTFRMDDPIGFSSTAPVRAYSGHVPSGFTKRYWDLRRPPVDAKVQFPLGSLYAPIFCGSNDHFDGQPGSDPNLAPEKARNRGHEIRGDG